MYGWLPSVMKKACLTSLRTDLKVLLIAGRVVVGLLASYLLFYAMLSICGHYQRADLASLHGVEIGYTWAPVGFYDRVSGWRIAPIECFYPLWYLDTCYVHKSKSST
jgi:hypothetical protein